MKDFFKTNTWINIANIAIVACTYFLIKYLLPFILKIE